MGWNLKRTVVMVGMMGAGKTAIGSHLAKRLGVEFLDSDEEIERAANMSVAEIFSRDGEPFFREKEAQVLERLLGGTPCILSTGGGAFLAPANRDMITSQGVSLWLKADLPLLWSRVKHKDTRPLLRSSDPRATLARIFDERTPIYALSDLTVEVRPGNTIDQTTERVIATLAKTPEILEAQP